MSKDDLFASMEWNGKTLFVYGHMPAKELKKIAEDFQNGIEMKHEQVEIVDGELVSPRLMAVVRNCEKLG